MRKKIVSLRRERERERSATYEQIVVLLQKHRSVSGFQAKNKKTLIGLNILGTFYDDFAAFSPRQSK